MNAQELLYESLKTDEHLLAYTIYWALQKGLLKGTDRFQHLQNIEIDYEEVEKLRLENVLNVKMISLWSLRKKQHEYVFIFADSEKSAKSLFLSTYNIFPMSIANADLKMDVTLWDELNGFETFREMRERTIKFPCIIANFETYVKSAEEVEQEYMKKTGKTLRRLEV